MSRWLPVAIALLLVACGGQDAEHYRQRGLELREAGQDAEARQAFELALRQAPADWRTHRDLAVLAADRLDDPALAVLHYRAAIAAAPQADRPTLARELEMVERRYYAELQARFAPPPPEPAPLPAPVVDTPAPAPPPAPPAASRTYTVRTGDTLASIARQVYGSATAWNRIYDANRDRLPSPDRLQVGQELRLPK